MSKTFENVIAPAFERGFDGLLKYLKRRGAKHFFKWLSLIFLKTHLKDRLLVADRSSRDPTPSKIGDMYDWDSLHHVHCVARSFHSRAQIRDEVVGTILIFRVEAHESYFDFADSYEGRTLLLCSKDIGIIAVLNDSGAVHTLMKPRLDAFEPPFSDVQARELFVVAAYCNQLVVDRPRYLTEVDLQTGQSEILAALPKESALNEWIPAEFGGMFAYYLKDMLPRIQHEDGLDMGELVRSGEFSFLFDRQGNFTPPEQLFVEQHDDPAKATHSEPQSDPAAAGKRSRGA